MKKLSEISWNVTEEEYRADPALSYSTLARYEREGFNNLDKLFDKIESPSLTFGSAVDALITGGQEEFDSKFAVFDIPSIPDSIVKIVKRLSNDYKDIYSCLDDIPVEDIIQITQEVNYQLNWKPETRAKVIKEKGSEYYKLLNTVDNKIILDKETCQDVYNAVNALKESEATKFYFAPNNPFEPNIERFYQLKFKANFDGITYRCMADCLLTDYKNKIIIPIDLKTSGHAEWDFYKSFVDWNYQCQARLYWRIIRQNLDKDNYFKDFKLLDYRFIVVNKKTLTPLVWVFPDTKTVGTYTTGKNNQIVMRDPLEIGTELNRYLTEKRDVPVGIYKNTYNNLEDWLDTL